MLNCNQNMPQIHIAWCTQCHMECKMHCDTHIFASTQPTHGHTVGYRDGRRAYQEVTQRQMQGLGMVVTPQTFPFKEQQQRKKGDNSGVATLYEQSGMM